MSLSKLEYGLIQETACGDEPLHILIGGFSNAYGLEDILEALVQLVQLGYLNCFSDDRTKQRPLEITLNDLKKYVSARAGEKLTEYPESCPEHHFYATKPGIGQLREEDRPEERRQNPE